MSHYPHPTGRRDLASSIRAIDIDDVVASYTQNMRRAPKRSDHRGGYLVPTHDGRGGATSLTSEKVRAKALFNRSAMDLEGMIIRFVDYEVPLRSARSDEGVGEVDLLGIDDRDRPWLIELKVAPNSETPLSALLQALRYAAILEANKKQLLTELSTPHKEARWDPVICVAADTEYWKRLHATKAAGDWSPALTSFADALSDRLKIGIVFVDIGSNEVQIDSEQRAQLVGQLSVSLAAPPERMSKR